MSEVSKRRKVDVENRQFNNKWTDGFAFILPPHANAKPLCLICQKTVAVCKVANIKRHYESKHASFSAAFPVGSIARKDKIEALKLSYSTTSTILTTSTTAAEKATAASLRVTWELAKKGKPFVDAELVKVCTLGIVEELFAGDKHKDDIVNRVKQVQLSDSTAARRLETLYEDSFSALLAELKCVDYMSVAVDESTDATDTAQLSVFVRYFNGELFKEELLCLLPLKSNTTGWIILHPNRALGVPWEMVRVQEMDGVATEWITETGRRLTKSLLLPMENDESRPRIDLVVFILTSELSFQSAEASLKYLDPGYFLGKVCFVVTNARNASAPTERLDAVRKLAASLHCPLLFAEDQEEIPKVIRQGFDEMLQFEKKMEEEKKRVYTYKKAVERLMSVNQTLSERSAKILLERGVVQVDGGVVFSRDFRINLTNIARISLEQSLELQSKITASVLVILAENGFEKIFAEEEKKLHQHFFRPIGTKMCEIRLRSVTQKCRFSNERLWPRLRSLSVLETSPTNVQLTGSISPFLFSEISLPVPWGEIRGRAWGPEHGHPVLCLHGWADNCGSFNALIPFLPKECRYVALDLPGHGLSSHRPPGVFYSFPAYVADVRRVAESLCWAKLSIMGHSMGGNIAVMFSAVYPEMVDAVIVLDVFGFVPTDPKKIAQIMRQGMDEMLKFEKKAEEKKRVYTYEKAVERLLTANPTLSEQSVQMLLERGLTQVEGGFVFSRDLRVNFKNIARITLEQSLEMQSMIQAPVLLILADKGLGAASAEVTSELSSKLLQVYRERNDTVVAVPGSHHVHLDNPEVVAPFICDFLLTKVLSQQSKA